MNLVAKLILETGGFVRPAEQALGPLRRVKGELAAVGREAERVGKGGGTGGQLALPAAAAAGTAGGVAAGAAPAVSALALVRTQLAAVAQEVRKASAPVAELRNNFRQLALEAGGGGGRGGRPIINVTPIAAARNEIVLARQELMRFVAARRLALEGGGEAAAGGGGSRVIYGPIGRVIGAAGRMVPQSGFGEKESPFGGLLGTVVRSAAPIAAATAVITGAFKSIKAAAQMEDFETSFSTLLGSMDAARDRMQELANFAETTPFELPEVAQASRVLETLTRGALSTGDGLRLVGDVAANTGQNFGELAMWIGRTYDGLQSGRPVGEALMRLQELGVMSGKTRSEIEQLQAVGKRGNEVWGVAAASFARFAGEMDRRSATLSGRWSNLKDSASAVLREIGGPLATTANEPLRRMSLLLDGIAKNLRTVKDYWMAAFGVVPQGKFPAPARPAAPAPTGGGSEQEINAALDQFFGPLDRLTLARRSIKESMAEAADARAQAVLGNPFSTDPERESALLGQARRAFRNSGAKGAEIAPGVRADPQSIDEAKAIIDARLRELEAMRENKELAPLVATEMEKLAEAFKTLVQLGNQLDGLRKNKVDAALEEFFGPMDKRVKAWDTAAPRAPGDQLTRIGGFVGAGGAANDHLRRTSRGIEILVKIAERNAAIDRGLRNRSASIDQGLRNRTNVWE